MQNSRIGLGQITMSEQLLKVSTTTRNDLKFGPCQDQENRPRTHPRRAKVDAALCSRGSQVSLTPAHLKPTQNEAFIPLQESTI